MSKATMGIFLSGMLGFLISVAALATQTIYIVQSDPGENTEGWHGHPLTPLTMRERLTLSGGEDQWAHREILNEFSRMKKKGYAVKIIDKIDVDRLLAIMSEPETIAIFHVGHSISYESKKPDGSRTREYFVPVYEGKESVPLNVETIQRAEKRMGSKFKPGGSLRLFFTTACYGTYCEAGLRTALRLPAQTTYVTSSKTMEQGERAIWGTFKREIEPWVTQLPDLSPSACFPAWSRLLAPFKR